MSLLKEFSLKQRKILLLMVLLSLVMILLGFVMDGLQKDTGLTRLRRPLPHESEKEVSFTITYRGEEKDESIFYEGSIGNQKLSEAEGKKAVFEAFSIVEKNLFRDGEDGRQVTSGINIPSDIEGSPVSISMEVNPPDLFLENGDVNEEIVRDMPVEAKLKIKIEYEDIEEEREYALSVVPKAIPKEEKLKRALKKEIDKVLKSDENMEISLPDIVEARQIYYFENKSEVAPIFTGIGIVVVLLAYFYMKNNNDKRKEKREEELKEAYPFFVGRFVILLGAGLNILGIWKKLGEGEGLNESLEEEIRLTLWELGNGKTEREAYENFGRRAGGMKYGKFAAILTENLKMGSSEILKRLEAEAVEAMLEKRNRAREIGEKIGTKLLMPMMLELVLIMLIIMVPAMLSAKT